jgi:hypothetical protein
MPEMQKKEPGRPDVEQPERGDPRLREPSVEKAPDAGIITGTSDGRPPATHDPNSPWLGGG